MKIRLVRLYSENNRFREINFKPGINLICGQKSVDEEGNTRSKKQNGVGKTLSIELVNFCLFKNGDSKVLRINDRFLHKKEFVYLHIKVDDVDVIIGRNKANVVRIKTGSNGEFQEYGFTAGKKYIEHLLDFNQRPVTLRDYFGFFIKEAGYTYEEFGMLYRATYADLLKIHFYMFGLPTSSLATIKGAYSSHDFATKRIRKVKKELKDQDIELEKLQAKKNALEAQVSNLEDNFEYSKILDTLQTRGEEINILERELEELILLKKGIEYDLSELSDFASQFGDDLYVDDKDLSIVFNRYKKGLGDLVAQDFEAVKKFRDQLSEYKSEIIQEKMNASNKKLAEINDKIISRRKQISKFYTDINQTNKNHIVKSFRVYRDELNEFQNYQSLLDEYDKGEYEANTAETNFAIAVGELSRVAAENKAVKQSFQKTFLEIHGYVTSSVEASFDFSVNAKFSSTRKNNYFKFNVNSETAGSTGANQMTAAIYDAALHKNEEISPKTYGLFVHDNLIFGLIEKDSSIKYLNYMNANFEELDVQYIATINMDEFNYDELKGDFAYDVTKDVIIELTRDNPLFREMSGSLIGDKPSVPDVEEEQAIEEPQQITKTVQKRKVKTRALVNV